MEFETEALLLVISCLHLASTSCWTEEPCPKDCRCSQDKSAIIVECSDQGFTRLPSPLPNCINTAYHLNFTNNNLTNLNTLPVRYNQDYLPQTEVLDLSYNQLQTVAGLFQGDIGRLKVVYLHSNHLTHLGDVIFTRLSQLSWISLSENPWQCSCQLKVWLATTCNDSDCHSLSSEIVLDLRHVQCDQGNSLVVPALEAPGQCEEAKTQPAIPDYVSVLIGLVLFYLLGCASAALCIVIRNRHKVKAAEAQVR